MLVGKKFPTFNFLNNYIEKFYLPKYYTNNINSNIAKLYYNLIIFIIS